MVTPIIVALDMEDMNTALRLAKPLLGKVAGFKVGLELIMSEGPTAVSQIADLGAAVFADVKLHDIPNTVGNAAFQLANHGARWVTVHASGGGEMISAAADGLAAGSGGRDAGVLAVTVLTSLDKADLAETGITRSLEDQVSSLGILASEHGAEGVVCSPYEASVVRRTSQDLLIVTPGIRLASGDHHDQKRVTTPSEAMRNGADMLVIGRAITTSADPVRTVNELVSSLRSESAI